MSRMVLDKDKMPKHVAIIMDGNRRWARKKGWSAVTGHDFVADKVLEPLVDRAIELGISYITFWAFSTENWERNKREVAGMMRIFRKGLKRSVKRLHEKGARLKILGDIDRFPSDIAKQAREWIEISKDNKKITVSFALNYGGRNEILRVIERLIAAKVPQLSGSSHLTRKVRDDTAGLESLPTVSNGLVTEDEFEKYLDTHGMPDPDLIIRTGGEQRLSGFMSWQSAYSELYFPETLMPDFTPREFDKAMMEYQRRSRRFGK